ncbi:AraC family transcriptional regulator [Halomonas sp. HP20-15]|uniref:helix-turn-helix transcriptional regulator n=1 Tax=Halomonas sp. HP20-15 TaxID=3085901 RepID=UPI0029828204|nr:AraC family transcriptional regulator [Halomonas sp. HP20-15]MDW5377495.1 AraC family transcriptional regulator [Halomonas sp. HP20-15]
MTATLPSTQAAPASQRLTIADFAAYERRYHLSHRFPALAGGDQFGEHMVAEGRIDEYQPWQGFQLVGSDLTVHQTYETHAGGDAPAHISIIVMLEGCAELTLGAHCHSLSAGEGVLLAFNRGLALSARHVAQRRVRAVNLTVTGQSLANDPRLAALALPCPADGPSGLWSLEVPTGLRQSLFDWLTEPPAAATSALLAEGLALQLLALGVARWPGADAPTARPPLASPRDRQLLARVRAHLAARPGEPHSLKALARLACMSPSSLRDKYRRAYGRSIFADLREYRLKLALRQLRDGHSVQQAAAQAGYRHATNFTTAFRQRYGIAPSEARQWPDNPPTE